MTSIVRQQWLAARRSRALGCASRLTRGTVIALVFVCGCHPADLTRVGSKDDNESVLLGEMATGLVRSTGERADLRRGLGGTLVVWEAVRTGQLDVYPEFTGTLALQIFSDPSLTDLGRLRDHLAKAGIGMTKPLGYENNYAIGVKGEVADRLGLRSVSDLAKHPDLRFGFSTEFTTRPDGWPGLKAKYGLPQTSIRSLDHAIAYRAVADGQVDGTDVYTTEAEIEQFRVKELADDRGFFPHYEAVLLYRLEWAETHPDALAALRKLEGTIDEQAVRRMNARVKGDSAKGQAGESQQRVAAEFLRDRFGLSVAVAEVTPAARIARHTAEHLGLVAAALVPAVLIGVPLGVFAFRRPRAGRLVIGIAGLIQTIPSLALLMFLLAVPPSLGGGLGFTPAAVALFLYALLPIIRNTVTGLADIPPSLREAADGLGLTPWAKLRLVELPMAARSILAGVKTSAVITIGTATLGAFIDAGGLGVPIREGLVNNDLGRILQGAIPATVLALVAEGLFDVLERLAVPRGLRLQ